MFSNVAHNYPCLFGLSFFFFIVYSGSSSQGGLPPGPAQQSPLPQPHLELPPEMEAEDSLELQLQQWSLARFGVAVVEHALPLIKTGQRPLKASATAVLLQSRTCFQISSIFSNSPLSSHPFKRAWRFSSGRWSCWRRHRGFWETALPLRCGTSRAWLRQSWQVSSTTLLHDAELQPWGWCLHQCIQTHTCRLSVPSTPLTLTDGHCRMLSYQCKSVMAHWLFLKPVSPLKLPCLLLTTI